MKKQITVIVYTRWIKRSGGTQHAIKVFEGVDLVHVAEATGPQSEALASVARWLLATGRATTEKYKGHLHLLCKENTIPLLTEVVEAPSLKFLKNVWLHNKNLTL